MKNKTTMQETLPRIAAVVEQRLKRFFEDVEDNPQGRFFETALSKVPAAQVRELTLRPAKRLRAALVWAGAALFDPAAIQKSAVVDTAAAMELLQTYLLIHDDIMDGSLTRRGGPAVHVALGAYVGDRRTGESLGILAGDLASAFTQILLSDLDVDEGTAKRIQQIFAAMHLDVVHGQSLDIMESISAYEIALHKTASYTTIGPLAAGAALSGARDADIKHLVKTAAMLGVAFQFRDDIIGTFGDPAVTGKSTDSDLLEGKRTVLIEEGRARADKLQWKRIERVLGSREAPPEWVADAREALAQCGARQACENHVLELTEEFIGGMDRHYFGEEAKQFLIETARYLGARNT